MSIRIGIDLSTTNTGVVVMDENNKVLYKDVVKLWHNAYTIMSGNIWDLLCDIDNTLNLSQGNIKVGIETSNFCNGLLNNRFHLLAGMLIAHLNRKWFNVCIKLFNANEWRQYAGITSRMSREECKLKARQICFDNGEKWAYEVKDDITDAYCIALYYDNCVDTIDRREITYQKKQAKKNKDKQKIKELKKELKLWKKK